MLRLIPGPRMVELRWNRLVMQDFAEFAAENFESSADLFRDNPRRGLATARFSIRNVAVTVSLEQMDQGRHGMSASPPNGASRPKSRPLHLNSSTV